MSSRFTAVPLASGESFILETDVQGERRVVLVDGGQSKVDDPNINELYQAIEKYCPSIQGKIDIAICTHRDHDHAGGFPAFVKAWLSSGKQIGEFWLPGAWSSAVEHLLTDPDGIVSLLVEGAMIAASRIADTRAVSYRQRSDTASTGDRLQSIDLLINKLRGSIESDFNAGALPTLGSWTGQLGERQFFGDFEAQERIERSAASWGFSVEEWRQIGGNITSSSIHGASLTARADSASAWLWYALDDISMRPLARTLAGNAIDTAEAIRAIASAAASFDIPVRWFDFEKFGSGNSPAGGYSDFLIPLNSVEVSASRREDNALILFLKLTLTEQNVSSLVFQRIETEDEPAVIFLADSRLAFGIDRPERDFPMHLKHAARPVIYTAAHHGSRNNDHAYKVLGEWLSVVYPTSMAVRNGGVWNQTLDGFLKVERRRCAQCSQCHGGNWSQLVQISTGGQNWVWPSGQGRACGMPK